MAHDSNQEPVAAAPIIKLFESTHKNWIIDEIDVFYPLIRKKQRQLDLLSNILLKCNDLVNIKKIFDFEYLNASYLFTQEIFRLAEIQSYSYSFRDDIYSLFLETIKNKDKCHHKTNAEQSLQFFIATSIISLIDTDCTEHNLSLFKRIINEFSIGHEALFTAAEISLKRYKCTTSKITGTEKQLASHRALFSFIESISPPNDFLKVKSTLGAATELWLRLSAGMVSISSPVYPEMSFVIKKISDLTECLKDAPQLEDQKSLFLDLFTLEKSIFTKLFSHNTDASNQIWFFDVKLDYSTFERVCLDLYTNTPHKVQTNVINKIRDETKHIVAPFYEKNILTFLSGKPTKEPFRLSKKSI